MAGSSLAALMLGGLLVVIAVREIVRRCRVGKLTFWLEFRRQPVLAFVLIARDPAFKVCNEDYASLPQRAGWVGPFRLPVGRLIFGVYVDEAFEDEAFDRIRRALAEAREPSKAARWWRRLTRTTSTSAKDL